MDPYLSDLRAAGKGTVLFHGNLGLTKAMIESFVERARAEGFRFAHPDCLVGTCQRGGGSGSGYGLIECPEDYQLETINAGGGRLCIDSRTDDAWGPFTRGMVWGWHARLPQRPVEPRLHALDLRDCERLVG